MSVGYSICVEFILNVYICNVGVIAVINRYLNVLNSFPGSLYGTVCDTGWFKSDTVWRRGHEQEAVE